MYVCFVFSAVLDKGTLAEIFGYYCRFHNDFAVITSHWQFLFFLPLSVPVSVKLHHTFLSNLASASTSFTTAAITVVLK